MVSDGIKSDNKNLKKLVNLRPYLAIWSFQQLQDSRRGEFHEWMTTVGPPAPHIQACAVEARMIRQWRERIEFIPDLLSFAGVSVLGFTSIIGSAIFIEYVIHH
jgi:hypothetical protein